MMLNKIKPLLMWAFLSCLLPLFAQDNTKTPPMEILSFGKNIFDEKFSPDFQAMSLPVKTQFLQGDVVFHGQVQAYCEKIVHELQQKQPEPHKKHTFYIWKSSAETCLSTTQGEILLPLGLLTQLESETEFTFLLAKEVSNIEQKTCAKWFSFAGKDWRGKTKTHLSENLPSLENELVSDSAAFYLLSENGYNLHELLPFFDNFISPYQAYPFEKLFFEAAHFQLPTTYFLKKIQAEKTPQNVAHHTQRKEKLLQYLATIPEKAAKNREEVEANFLKNLATSAKIEEINWLLGQTKYEAALFAAHQAALSNAETFPFEKQVAKALYGYTKKRNHSNDSVNKHLTLLYNTKEGELQQVCYFLGQLRNNELNVLAANYIWRLRKANANDLELNLLAKDIFQELVDFHYEKIGDFSSKPLGQNDSIELKLNWVKYAFSNYMADSAFSNQFKRAKANKELEKKVEAKEVKLEKKGKTKIMEQEVKGARLGIANVVVVQPEYQVYAQQKVEGALASGTTVDIPLEKESMQQNAIWLDALKINAEKTGINAKFLTVNDITKQNIETLNDYLLLNAWAERQQLRANEGNFVDMAITEIVNVTKKYNTDYFLWAGVEAIQTPKKVGKTILQHVKAVLIPSYLPATVRYDMKKAENAHFYATLYQVKTGKKQIIKDFTSNQPLSKSFLHAHLYDTFMQIKARK